MYFKANIVTIKVKSFFTKGHERTLSTKKNILVSFLMKGGGILVSIVLIPLTINYVNPNQYGIWLTLSSLIGWFNYFDIGLGNGLKNKLSEAISVGDNNLAKTYISTTYATLAIISLFLLSSLVFLNHFLNWSTILNTNGNTYSELKETANVIFIIFSLQFVFQLINVICFSTQNTKISSIINFSAGILSLILIYVCIYFFPNGKLIYLCYSVGFSPLIVLAIASVILFKTRFKELSPSFEFIDFKKIKVILNLGYKFFFIQIGQILFFNTDNIIISNIIGADQVTSYNIGFKYFNVITMVCGIIMAPFWPAFIEAKIKNDVQWIKLTVQKLEKICILFLFAGTIMVIFSNYVYKIWIGDLVTVPISLSIVLAIYTVVNTYRTIFCSYINSTGKISIQLMLILISGVLNIPFGIVLGKYFGTTGVILSTTILCILCGIIEIIQYRKLIGNSAFGIWNS